MTAFRVLDAPRPLMYDPESKPCRYCRLPCRWRDRQAVTHPACTGWTDVLTDQALARLVYALARAGGVASVTVVDTPGPERAAPPRYRTGPCTWCSAPGIGITADTALHCAAHMWPPYRVRP